MRVGTACGFILIVSMLTGCMEATLDASSDEKTLQSTARLRGNLTGVDQAEFDRLVDRAISVSTRSEGKISIANALASYNGLNASQVVSKIRKLEEQEAAQLQERDRALLSRMREIKSQVASLSRIVISDVIIDADTEIEADIKKASWLTEKAKWHASVNNGLPFAISRLKIKIEVRSPDRDEHWTHGELELYTLIESGELVRQSRSANDIRERLGLRGARNTKIKHPDAKYVFSVSEVHRQDGTIFPDVSGVSDADWKKFKELEDRFGAEKLDGRPSK